MSKNTDVLNGIAVEFTLSEEIWNTVVVDAGEDEKMYVDNEGREAFVVIYDSQASLDAAVNRFNGDVEYRIVE